MNAILIGTREEKRVIILEKMNECAAMPFTAISNSANQFFQTAYSHAHTGPEDYIEYCRWYYEKGCDILDHPEKYEGMHCTEIVETFNNKIQKRVKRLHKENHNDYLALA